MLVIRALVVVVCLGALAGVARGECTGLYTVETYFQPKPKDFPDKPTSRCDVKDGKCISIRLNGYLFQGATGKGPHPLIILNHGSEAEPSPECAASKTFLDAGYIVFLPIRRGHGSDDNMRTSKLSGVKQLPERSTGAYFDAYANRFCSDKGNLAFCDMEYLHIQIDDLEEAIHWVHANVPNVDKKRLAMVGYSFGGIVTTFANAKDLGQRAVVAGAAGSESWASDVVGAELAKAVRNAVAPTFFFQPMNDPSIDSTIFLARTAGHNCRQYQSALFPAVNTRITADKGDKKDVDYTAGVTKADYATVAARKLAHGSMMGHPEIWGSAVLEFLGRNLARPGVPNNDFCIGTSHSSD